VADPADFSKVKLLLHCDGSNGSTTFTDSSQSGRTVTAFGTAQISTAQSKWGGASALFDGTGDYLTVPNSADFDFGTGDWTIEFWYRPTVVDTVRTLIGKAVGTGFYPFNIRVNGSGRVIGYCTDGSSVYTTPDAAPAMSAGTWYHIAFVRASNALKVYVNGVATGAAVTMTAAHQTNSAPLCIGNFSADYAAGGGATAGAHGYLDDLRITKGEALYTTDFTPPSAPFPEPPEARIAAAGPLGAAQVLSRVTPVVRASAAGPLGAPAMLAAVRVRGIASAPAVLQSAAVVGYAPPVGRVTAAGPLGAALLLARAVPAAVVAAPGPLGAAALLAEHDFTDVLEAAGAVEFYVCDLVDGEAVVRVPVSSWQGTQQVDGSCYLQAVVPAVADMAATITGLSAEAEFIISRGARLPTGGAIENEMARSTVEQVQLDQGPQRYTCTISGYSAAIEPPEGDGPTVRTLRGVRSISSGTGGARARCAIDWFLRPGGQALAGSVPLVADYINYYVEGRDAYMDVGERA